MDQVLENLKGVRKMKIGFSYNHLYVHMEFSKKYRSKNNWNAVVGSEAPYLPWLPTSLYPK